MLVPDLLRTQASAVPERVALRVDRGPSLDYGAWEAQSNRLARALTGRGIAAGDRVGLLFSNAEATDDVVAYLAVHKAGAVAVPLGPRAPAPELERLVRHAGASAVLCGAAEEPLADAVRAASDVAVVPAAEQGRARAEGDASTYQVPRSGEDLADLLYTSGTTGEPKAVACSHASVTFQGSATLDRDFRGAVFLHAIPLHTFAGCHAMTLLPLRGAMTSIVMPAFDAGRYVELLRAERVHLSYAVPSMLLLALEESGLRGGGFEALRLLMYGTAPMPPAAIGRLAEALPGTSLLNLYGLTEGGAAVCLLSPSEATRRPGSVGRPLPPTEVRIAGEDGRPLPPYTAGEVWLRAPAPPRHYYRDEPATRAAWTGDGWLRTGDIGKLDGDGFLYLIDRKKDLVIRGGLNVSVLEVEAALGEHPAVREAAIVGVPHPVLGEDTFAFVALREHAAVGASELEAFLRARISPHKVPRRYAFVAELPRNDLGKILKQRLRAAALARDPAVDG